MSIWPENINTAFDLELRSSLLGPAALFVELALKAPTAGEMFIAGRTGNDDGKHARFAIWRLAGPRGYLTEFCLTGDAILVAHVSSVDCEPHERVNLCWKRLEPLFSAIPPVGKSHISIVPISPKAP